MTTATTTPAAPPAPRQWWIRRHWKRLGVGFLLLMITLVAAWWIPRRTMLWVSWNGGYVLCSDDHIRTIEILDWLNPRGFTKSVFDSVERGLSFSRTDRQITNVMLYESPLTTNDLFQLQRLTGLKTAALHGQQLGPGLDAFRANPELHLLAVVEASTDQMRELKRLPQLESVSIVKPLTGDIGLESLADLPRLNCLHFSECTLMASHLESLPDLPSVTEFIAYRCTEFQGDDLRHLKRLPNLQTIDLMQCVTIDDFGIEHLSHLEQLETLCLRTPWTEVTDAGLAKLAQMKSLKTIAIMRYQCSPEQIDRLKRAVPDCELIY